MDLYISDSYHLIIEISGNLAEFLLEKGYEVHGIVRRASISNTARIEHQIEKNVIKTFHYLYAVICPANG